MTKLKYIHLGKESYSVYDDYRDVWDLENGWIICGRIKDGRIQPVCLECGGDGCYSCNYTGFYRRPRLPNVIQVIQEFKERTGITKFEE